MNRFKFEQIAINCKDKRKPTKEDMDTYIGLEHLDPGCLQVRRWGSSVPIKGEKLIMHTGDVLLGKRNAYLRRAAIAPHDGLFSAHGMILNPHEDVVDKDFFPHFILSDYFFDEAIKISVGSLSPTINWRDIAKVEFNLPALDKQKELARVLWAITDTIEYYKELITMTDELIKARFTDLFGNLDSNTNQYPICKLNEIADYWNGLTYKPDDATQDGSGTIVLRSSNIQNGELDFNDIVRVTCPIKEKLYVRDNDILMCSRNGSAALVGKTAIIKDLEEEMSFGAFMMIVRSDYYPFLNTYFAMPAFRQQITTGTSTINQITKKMLDQIKLPVPDMDTVLLFDEFVEKSTKSKNELKQAMAGAIGMYKNILRDAFNKE